MEIVTETEPIVRFEFVSEAAAAEIPFLHTIFPSILASIVVTDSSTSKVQKPVLRLHRWQEAVNGHLSQQNSCVSHIETSSSCLSMNPSNQYPVTPNRALPNPSDSPLRIHRWIPTFRPVSLRPSKGFPSAAWKDLKCHPSLES